MAYLTEAGCYSLSGRGCGNTGLCYYSCLRKSLVKEQITICTESQAAIAALSSQWYKITACRELYRKTDSSVGSKPGNYNVGIWA